LICGFAGKRAGHHEQARDHDGGSESGEKCAVSLGIRAHGHLLLNVFGISLRRWRWVHGRGLGNKVASEGEEILRKFLESCDFQRLKTEAC
jgi:hypothetical protein